MSARPGWLGLREFSGNRYPKLWKPVEHYFPDGLVNSLGEPVTDLIEECVARDIHQQPCHARWVECPDREHQCFYMDRNNPVWREYLKAVIRIQIDAGVDGIQLDEAELPMGAFQYGACFCKDCLQLFREHLRSQPAGAAQPAARRGRPRRRSTTATGCSRRATTSRPTGDQAPLFGDYYRAQCAAIKRYFAELAEYARSYGRSVGREVLVSGNFFNLDPSYLALAEDVDLVITEMRNTTYRQPEWYRYVAAFTGDKDVVVVENPYGGVVPELVELLGRGRGHDLFRLSLYEGAAFGANMTVPVRRLDGGHDPGRVLPAARPGGRDPDLPGRPRAPVQQAVVARGGGRVQRGEHARAHRPGGRQRQPGQRPRRLGARSLPGGDRDALAARRCPFDVVIFTDGETAPDRVDARVAGRLPHGRAPGLLRPDRPAQACP